MKLKKLHLQGFKSIASMHLDEMPAFSVFAGANGSGKSNFVDGLAFFGALVKRGAIQALREHGGYSHVHCFKHRKSKARTASLDLIVDIDEQSHEYSIKIYDMDVSPKLEEKLVVDGRVVMHRKKGSPPELSSKSGDLKSLPDFPDEMSALMVFGHTPIYQFLTNICVFRFDPFAAKEPDDSSADADALDSRGRNIATILSVLEKNESIREQILEWIELLVPGLEKVGTEKQRLDGTTVITFKEEGLRTRFPTKLISDGTIYALCILTAVFSRAGSIGITVIEEPERGIHPLGISQLVSLMRESATVKHPVFVTTHSESVIRNCRAEELWVVNKIEGKTVAKNAGNMNVNLGDMKLDMAWLMNMFDGGLPW